MCWPDVVNTYHWHLVEKNEHRWAQQKANAVETHNTLLNNKCEACCCCWTWADRYNFTFNHCDYSTRGVGHRAFENHCFRSKHVNVLKWPTQRPQSQLDLKIAVHRLTPSNLTELHLFDQNNGRTFSTSSSETIFMNWKSSNNTHIILYHTQNTF